MRFRDFCQNFPVAQEDWPLVRPSKVIPMHWREVLYARMGSILAASDRSRAKSSSRLGVSLRPYQAGDRLATLSLPHMMRADELLSRVDEAPGQFAARIFVITTESLQFRSDYSSCTKGQVALGIAGLIEAVHLRQNQSVRVIYCTREQLETQIVFHLHPQFAGAAVSVVSDFLDKSLEHDLIALKQSNIQTAALYCVRDALEEAVTANPLGDLALELDAPAQTAPPPARRTFSGKKYVNNLLIERELYERAARDAHCRLRFVTETEELFNVVKTVTDSYALARFALQPTAPA